MTLRITSARKELLQAIADGAVKDQYSIGAGWNTDWDRGPGWDSRPGARRFTAVTARVFQLSEAGLCRRGGISARYHDPRPWEITDAGRAALDGAS
jgi:hypothetical protein